jgi:hypothetical protein
MPAGRPAPCIAHPLVGACLIRVPPVIDSFLPAGHADEEAFAGAWLIRIVLLLAWVFLRTVRPCELGWLILGWVWGPMLGQ